jgi:hypothetical protein
MTSRRLPQIVLAIAIALLLVQAVAAKKSHRLRSFNLPSSSLFSKAFHSLGQDKQAKTAAILDRVAIPAEDVDNLRLDHEGSVFYSDSFHVSEKADTGKTRRNIVDVSPSRFLSNGLPIYHSKPGATKLIFLDFDGHDCPSSSAWGSFQAKPYNPSGNDPSMTNPSFSSYEARQIGLIWQRIAEDYAPFNVDVTTEEPSTWTKYMVHLLVTESTQRSGARMPAYDAGGVAYVGVYGYSDFSYYRPALVYYDNLSSQESYIAEAASHEIGHNLGLSHDGTSSYSYYGGDADYSDDSWGPVCCHF